MSSIAFGFVSYLKYLFKSGNRHSVHSPFVYSLVDEVIRDRQARLAYSRISDLRKLLSKKSQLIEITDFGAGAGVNTYEHRFESVASIAQKSAVNEKYGQLLFRLVEHFKPKTIVELGTSLGISTLYLALPDADALVITVEGCTTKSEQAASNFESLGVTNLHLHIGRFDIVLPDVIKEAGRLDFAFIDGHHLYKSTMANFEALLQIAHNDTVFVFDDIHWSPEMEKAWAEISDHQQVTVSIDLFRMGIVFLKKELSKQNFVIRF